MYRTLEVSSQTDRLPAHRRAAGERPPCAPRGTLALLRPRSSRRGCAPAGTVTNARPILLCDPASQSLRGLRVILQEAGFEVDATRTAGEALDRGALRAPGAAIIERALPDGDGVELCRRLRAWSAMPVIMLSAVSDEEEQVRAFQAGVDDYLTKPFRARELVARLHAKLRRAAPRAEEPCVALDGLQIDLAARVVHRDGVEIHLTPIEFELLAALVQNRGRLLTHNALLQRVWGAAYADSRQTLRAHIANLRRKIEPSDGARLIHTGHGVGYRLMDWPPDPAGSGRPAQEFIDPQAAPPRVLAL